MNPQDPRVFEPEGIPTVLAMDAHMNVGFSQFNSAPDSAVLCDLHKAHLAFGACSESTVSTGQWGCGAFGGNVYLKYVQV